MVDGASVLGERADTGDVKGYEFLLGNIGTLKLPQEVQSSEQQNATNLQNNGLNFFFF